jgi:hypothetical protein
MIKLYSILLISAVLCLGGKVRVENSTSQEWVGGLQESGYGTDYKVYVTAKASSEHLQFTHLWVDGKCLKVRAFEDVPNSKLNVFGKGSRLTVRAGVTQKPGADGRIGVVDALDIKKPYDFKGKGLLGYTFKGKELYVEITDFKILEKLIYP